VFSEFVAKRIAADLKQARSPRLVASRRFQCPKQHQSFLLVK
jgi:hypothetical protein